jgi:hypothetical protein
MRDFNMEQPYTKEELVQAKESMNKQKLFSYSVAILILVAMFVVLVTLIADGSDIDAHIFNLQVGFIGSLVVIVYIVAEAVKYSLTFVPLQEDDYRGIGFMKNEFTLLENSYKQSKIETKLQGHQDGC